MKIQLNRLRGSNVLAYGDFDIQLDKYPVYQLIGRNGSGKSSIPVILEEILYNNNSRGIKKAKLVNRKTGKAGWFGEVTFKINEDEYIVTKQVAATTKLLLTVNGKDISGHTATQTYALIKTILGDLDFKTFSKLVYQSIGSSLDFLKATDTERKKFLTSFLGLGKYSSIESVLKARDKEIALEIDDITNKLTKIKTWLAKSNELTLIDISSINVPKVEEFNEDLADLSRSLDILRRDNKDSIAFNAVLNSKVARIKEAKKEQSALDSLLSKVIQRPTETYHKSEHDTCKVELTKITTKMDLVKKQYQGYRDAAAISNCLECGHPLDIEEKVRLREQYKQEFLELKVLKDNLTIQTEEHIDKYKTNAIFIKYETDLKNQQSIVDTYKDIDNTLDIPKPIVSEDFYLSEIKKLQDLTKQQSLLLKKAEIEIAKAETNNILVSKREVELEEYKIEAQELQKVTETLREEKGSLAVLIKAFSPKGLIGYKIESSVKIFEELINKYLTEFTDGQFALSFKIDGSKLLVIIFDEGEETDMSSLSSGEEAKVNISTLLAIRNLMSVVSKVDMNVLFLDEVISVLDTEATQTLIEVLLEERSINSFIVSHNFEHPLTKTLKVIKKGATSAIYE